MRRKYILIAACCSVAIVMAGCGSRPPDASTAVKKTLSASRTSSVSLQFTTADGYLGSGQLAGQTRVAGKDNASSYTLSASGANRGYLQCVVNADTARNQTTVQAPDELREALASAGTSSGLTFDGTDNLGIGGVGENLESWIAKNKGSASFSRTGSNPFTQNGRYFWTLRAGQAGQILKPVQDALSNPLGKAVAGTVDSGFASAFAKGLAAGGRTYTLGIDIANGAADEIDLQSKGFVSPQSLQAQADPWTGTVTAGKIADGFSLTVKIRNEAVSATSGAQSAASVQ